MKHSLFSDVLGEFGGLSNQAWMAMGLFGIVSAGADVLEWRSGPVLSLVDYLLVAITTPLALFAAYVAGGSMVSRRVSVGGFLRFVGGFVALFFLLIVGIGSLLALLPSSHKNVIVAAALILIFLGWLAMIFLPAWPIAQALSSKMVSPMRLLRGTKGHRWSLFLMTFATSSLNSIVPSTAKAKNLPEAVLYALGNGAMSVFTITLFVALSVTAWRYASANDKELYGDEPRAAGVF